MLVHVKVIPGSPNGHNSDLSLALHKVARNTAIDKQGNLVLMDYAQDHWQQTLIILPLGAEFDVEIPDRYVRGPGDTD